MSKKSTIHFIPQTHWDKEWYFTKHVSDVFLIENINKMIEIFKRDKTEIVNYIYDGQYSIIDDYLAYYPENIEIIKEMVKANVLILGPWYTQTDTFNAAGESIVRNLLVGSKSTQKLGGTPMKVGYLPDSFGFNSNMPQILKKANLKAIVHWRGVYDEMINKKALNAWEGIDGTIIPEFNLYKWGYNVGVFASFSKYLGEEGWSLEKMKEQAAQYFEEIQERLKVLEEVSSETQNEFLLPFGSDQLPIYEGYRQWMEETSKIDNEREWIVSNYDKYFEKLLKKVDISKLNLIKGELRFGHHSKTHKTIGSGRYDIKRLVRKLEYLIYSELEPLAIVFEKMGGKYPTSEIEICQKKLLECQAHDSLGGCNTDETNFSILERLNAAIDTCSALSLLIRRRISSKLGLKNNQLIVFNLKPYINNVKGEIEILTKKRNFDLIPSKKIDFEINLLKQKFMDDDDFKIIDNSHLKGSDDYDEKHNGYYSNINLIEIKNMEPISYIIFDVSENENKKEIIKKVNNNLIENDFYKIEINNDGKLNLLNKKTNKNYDDFIWFESNYDAGDSYDYSPEAVNSLMTAKISDFKFSTIENSKIKTLKISYEFLVPEKLHSQNKIIQKINFEVILHKELINLKINIDNIAKDIRWRMILDTQIKSELSYSNTAFGIVEHKTELKKEFELFKKEKWCDWPIEIENMESVCYLKDDKEIVSVFTKGTNEFQIIGSDKNKIALTLFRGYSYIGRRDLIFRPGLASGINSYPHATDDGNLNKKLNFEIAVSFNEQKNIVKNSKDWCEDLVYYQIQRMNEYKWKGDTFVLTKNELKLDWSEIKDLHFEMIDGLVMSCFKMSYDQDGYIIRLYNASEKTIDFKKPDSFEEVNLLEEKLEVKNDNYIFKSNEVKTFFIKK